MGLWSWLRGVSQTDTSAPSLPSDGKSSGRDAAAPPSIRDGARFRPCSGPSPAGVHPVARLGDFAGSLATWQSRAC
jgi:hypothetical protein